MSIDGGTGALGAAQPREAPVPADPGMGPGRATAEDGVATGVCDGQLEVWSTVMGKSLGMIGCVEKWKVGCVEIKKGKVVTAKQWEVVQKLGESKEGGGILGNTQPREEELWVPRALPRADVPAS